MLPVVFLSVAAFGVLCLLYAWLIERNWFVLRRHRVPCLPPGAAPMTILHVSDLHFRANLASMRRFLARLGTLHPDLVVGTGDFLGDDRSASDCAQLLGAIPARLGGVFVLGSNDYYAPVPKSPHRYLIKRRSKTKTNTPRPYHHGPTNEWQTLVGGLEQSGWRLMLNQAATIGDLDIVGFDDPHIHRHDFGVIPPRNPGRFRLAVVHSPEIAPELATRDFDLIVAGHTHGGQLRIPGFGALITNTESLPRRMARGLHRIGPAWLHVSAGMGTSKYAPVRFSCRPEACLLELVARP